MDPDVLMDELLSLRPIARMMQAAVYRNYGLRANAIPKSFDMGGLDHLSLIGSIGSHVKELSRLGITTGPAVLVQDPGVLSSTVSLLLAGSGVQLVIVPSGGDAFRWLESPDGTHVLAATIPPGGTPQELGFTQTRGEMTARIEGWLTTSPHFLRSAYEQSVALVLNSVAGDELPAIHAAVSDWNARFAYPTFRVDDVDGILGSLQPARGAAVPVTKPEPTRRSSIPSSLRLRDWNRQRSTADTTRTDQMLSIFAGLVQPGSADLTSIASQISAIVPGTVVFNPSPFSRSGFVRLCDGSERVVTNIPGLGYAYFPDESDGETREWTATGQVAEIQGQRMRVSLDTVSGAIRSLKDRSDGRELVRDDSAGLNAVDEARLEGIASWRLPNIATRLEAQRWSPGRGSCRTTVTAYDQLPWIDIENEAGSSSDQSLTYRFEFAVPEPLVSWEVPLGQEESSPPVVGLEHLRWVRLAGDWDAILFRGFDAPFASVDAAGSVTSHAPAGLARYRLGVQSHGDGPDLPWQFGWATGPFQTARVEPHVGGRLPTFGAFLDVERVGVAVLGLVPTPEEDTIILYLQELLGVPRDVSVSWGLIRFGTAQPVDFLERPSGEPLPHRNGTVRVPVAARGVTAVPSRHFIRNSQPHQGAHEVQTTHPGRPQAVRMGRSGTPTPISQG
ncbi:MAG: hypothetical protein AMS18_00970 [Gemmatimonas sp. SG8_17]|nr:MAG: hypothetical protein AMS18_00970 [Gemmatimonas sp. SG8_17]